MNLQERIPLERINAIAAMSYAKFKELSTKCKNEKDREEYFKQFKFFCESHRKSKGVMLRCYANASSVPVEVGGRLFGANSIQGIATQIRGFLLEGTCTDIDMKNAHPCILAFICRKHGIMCPHLDYYIANRDAILQKMPNGKIVFLKAVNMDTKQYSIHDEFFRLFDTETKSIQKQILALDDYKHIAASVPIHKERNKNGSFINRVLCFYENMILMRMVSVLTAEGIEIMSLMFDGCMVYGNYYSDAVLLGKLEAATAEFGIRLAYKPHDSTFHLDDMSDIEEREETDESCAVAVVLKFPHFKYCRGDFYAYDVKSGIWSQDPIFIESVVKQYGGDYTTNMTRRGHVTRAIEQNCQDPEWLLRTEKSSIGKLLFKNGYYDSETKELCDFNPEIVFFGRISYDYVPVEDTDDVERRFFTDPLGEVSGRRMLGVWSRAALGIRQKKVFFGLGAAQAGKSTTSEAVKNAFEDYVGTFTANDITFKQSSADEAAKLRWALLLRHKRIIISNEIETTQSIDGNMLKKLGSGTDDLIGRTHGGNETRFSPTFLPVVMANDMPKIKPLDTAVSNRLEIVSYKKPFVDEPTGPHELKSDPNVSTEIMTLEFKQTLVSLFIKYFHLPLEKSEDAAIAMGEWVDAKTNIIDVFLNAFELTQDPAHFIPSADIEVWVGRLNLGISYKAFCIMFDAHCTKTRVTIERKDKKIGKKVSKHWFGLQKQEEEEEEGNPEA